MASAGTFTSSQLTLQREHPMYVIRVSTLLDSSFKSFRPHEELKAEGLLVEYQEEMSAECVLFCSHTWLRRAHPDNEAGVKLALLKAVLRRAVEGTLDVHGHWINHLTYKSEAKRIRLKGADVRRDMADGYVFMDYSSIPQADAEAQKCAIASLVSYVSTSAYFMCLAGPWTYEDGSSRDDAAWAGRGWCRMELTGNALSPSTKPIIVATSPTAITTFPPGGTQGREWLVSARVGHGAFTVEADKASLGPLLRNLIAARKGLALSDGDMIFYRTLHAASSWLLEGCGTTVPDEHFNEWMSAMRFKSATDDARSTGVTPLHFAIMTGRVGLVSMLLDRGAPIECASKLEDRRCQIGKGCTPLTTAAQYARDGTIIELLLRRGAESKRVDQFGNNALHWAFIAGNVEGMRALMRHDVTLADVCNHFGYTPFNFAPCFGHVQLISVLQHEYPQHFEASVRELDVSRHTPVSVGLCTLAINNGVASPDILNAVLDAGEPIDLCIPKATKGPNASIIRAVDMIAWLRPIDKLPSFVFAYSYLTRTTALHAAAFFGKLAAADLLLARGASVNSTANPKGMTPLHLAAIGGHPDVVSRLLDKGADLNIKDKRGRTALKYATKLGRDAMRPLLTNHLEPWAPPTEPTSALEPSRSKGVRFSPDAVDLSHSTDADETHRAKVAAEPKFFAAVPTVPRWAAAKGVLMDRGGGEATTWLRPDLVHSGPHARAEGGGVVV